MPIEFEARQMYCPITRDSALRIKRIFVVSKIERTVSLTFQAPLEVTIFPLKSQKLNLER